MIGAGRYERTEKRRTERNGTRPRTLTTTAGDVQLRIPKLRKGCFFPSILNPRRRIDQALYAVVMEAYVNGVSTRAVDDLVAAMGSDTGISKSEVSRICAGLDEMVAAFRTRTLGHTGSRTCSSTRPTCTLREASRGQVVSQAVVVATGVTEDGGREILGLDVGDSEDETFWRAFLTSLRSRGLGGVQLVISDQHAGLVMALTRCFAGAAHQRCRVHFARNLLALVPKSHKDMVAAVFRTIFAHPEANAVAATWDHVRDELSVRFPKIGPLMDEAKTEVLAFTAIPRAHWTKIWSNNPIERLNREINRRARVVGIFPNGPAVIRLVGAVLADAHDEWQVADRRSSPKRPWRCCTRPAILTPPPSPAAREHRGTSPQSPPPHGRFPRSLRESQAGGRCP
ncbi:IS256-like element IS1553 family transposase [Terrabacter terrigena]|uniref:Mutator family transposase n=1 Tax=Terrabacter terrigena TaxID=574718 RepID=A0ABW3N4Q7_9MICO